MAQRFDATTLGIVRARRSRWPAMWTRKHPAPTPFLQHRPTAARSPIPRPATPWINSPGSTPPARISEPSAPRDITRCRDFLPMGKRLALTIPDPESGNRDIWILELASGSLTRFTTNPANDWIAAWSPDGKYLAFASDRTPHSSIYRKAVDGSGEEELLVPAGETGGVFPDGLVSRWPPAGVSREHARHG